MIYSTISFGHDPSTYKDKNLPSKMRSNDRLCPGNDMDMFQTGREIPDPPYLRSLNCRRKWGGHKVRLFEKRVLCSLATFLTPAAFNGSLCCLRAWKSLPGVYVSLKVGDPANKRRREPCKNIGYVIFFINITGHSVSWISIEPRLRFKINELRKRDLATSFLGKLFVQNYDNMQTA